MDHGVRVLHGWTDESDERYQHAGGEGSPRWGAGGAGRTATWRVPDISTS